MCSNKAHMARNSKNYCRCNVFFRPLRQINLEINKCHVEAFPLLWSKNRVFYCLIKPTGLLFPSSTHHHTQFSWKGTEPGRPHFPLSLFPSLAPRACYYGVGFARRLLSWESPLLKLNFWSMVSTMKNGMADICTKVGSISFRGGNARRGSQSRGPVCCQARDVGSSGGLSASSGYLCRIWCWWLRLCRVAEGEEDPDGVWDCSLKGDARAVGCRQLLPTCEQHSVLLLRSWWGTRWEPGTWKTILF